MDLLGWQMKVKIGTLTKIRTGKLDANASSEDGQYPFFTCSREALRISSYSYDCECVLVAGNGDLNVKYYNGKFDAYQRTYIIEDNSDGKLYMPYLYYFMEGYIDELRKQAIGGVIKYIKLGNLTNALIELPSMDKQKDVVNILEMLTGIIDLRNDMILKLDELVKSRFVELFGECRKRVFLNDLCSIITDGTHQPPKFQSDGVPFIFVSNLARDIITYDTEKYISAETYLELYKRTPIEIGDVLLSTVGSYGHPAVVTEAKKFLFQRHIAYLKPKHDIVNSFFLHSALLSPDGQRQIKEKVKGIAQKTLNLSEIRKIEIPLPELQKQNQFADFAHQVDKSKFRGFSMLTTMKSAYEQQTLIYP